MHKLLTTLCVIVGSLALASADAAERRVALVIGNSWYENTDPLLTARGDAIAMAEKLQSLDFEVTLRSDLDQRAMQIAVHDFAEEARRADIALIFYAGHGLQLDGANHLVSVNAALGDVSHLPFEALPLSAVLEAVATAHRLGLVLLDAARVNPLATRLARSLGSEGSRVAPGLAGVVTLPPHIVVAFADAEGVAGPDRRDEHSPYTAALLAHLAEPGVELRAVLERVRETTLAATGGAQAPRYDGAPGEEPFYLALEAFSAAPVVGEAAPPPAEAAAARAAEPGAVVAAEPRMLEPFRDCAGCPEMIPLPAGSFVMGRDRGDPSERPAHEVRITRPFAIGRHEVTVAEWAACVAAGACPLPEVDAGSDRSPMRNLSFDDARRYVAWLSSTTGKTYRVPTEAEWEFAARGGTRTVYWWGDDVGGGRAGCSDCGGDWDRRRPAEVGSFPGNPFGLHDTSGGVAEWVEDCWARSHAGAPVDGSPRAERVCVSRVLRGGSWRNGREEVASASRLGYDAVVRYYANGLRVARELE
jgi:formylglycine-generating enzyme required for sulfatase activity